MENKLDKNVANPIKFIDNLIFRDKLDELRMKVDLWEKTGHIPETTKITHLNTDCLEAIFENLSFNTLLNVADSNKHFFDAACRVFKRKYLHTNMIIDTNRYSYCRERSEVTDALEWNPQIGISNPILAFKLLRNFGHMIRNLGIDFTVFNAKICAEIENYLVEYCCDSLQRLSLVCGSLDNLMKIPFDDLKKPLKNVTTVKIQTIHNTKLNHIRFINQNNLPNVKHILIYHDATYLDDSEQKIHYETVEYFTVIYAGFQITKYPFSFGRLKHIIFKYLHIQLIDAFSEFINSIGHLQTLKIMNMDFQMDQFQKVLELENIQSNIVELQFAYIKHVSTDDIVRFLNQSHKLRKLTIHQNIWFKCFENYIPSLVETMSSKLNVEWKVCNINLRKHPFEGCSEYTACVIERIID